LKLFKGTCQVVGRRSPFALSEWSFGAAAHATEPDALSTAAAEGFIRIWGLPTETAARKGAGAQAPVGR
jgi:argininosuccinate synthase